tara:strand:+ start:1560 stop:1817 length:258 start_codon:yes stop_codon:yes gene_type:complete
MELNYINVLFAFWIATVLMSVWRLWWPSMQIIKIVSPDAPMLQWQWISLGIFTILSTLIAPLLIPAILIERYRVVFVSTYIGAMK